MRVPQDARKRTNSLRWISTLQDLRHPAGGSALAATQECGEHLSLTPVAGGYVAAAGEAGTEAILPVRCIAPTAPPEVIVPESHDGSVAIALQAVGGAREIGANCYYYTFGHRGVVVDAGFDATRDGWLGLPALERIPRLDAVVLTHAHLDHIGALPSLLAAFPEVPVYCTRATLAVLVPQLRDSATVSSIRFHQTGEAPAVSRGLVDAIRPEQFRTLDYGVQSQVPQVPGLALTFSDAGHIIGSATARLEFGGVTILHTGDISVEDQHLLRGMAIANLQSDHVVMEGTYCGEPEFTRAHRRLAVEQFLDGVAERIDAGGSILVPAFSLGRAQELVGMLVDWNERTGRSVPIWTVGMVNQLNDVSAEYPEFLPGLRGRPFSKALKFPQADRGMSEEERRDWFAREFKRLAADSPSVIIASHGMMTEGTGSYLIGRAILAGEDSRHAIFLCGYMDPRTPGFRLRHQCDDPIIDFGAGDPVPRRIPSERIRFYRLTAHASYEELLEVALGTARRSVTFIHGDGTGLDALIRDLHDRLRSTGRELILRAPAIGERLLIARAEPPPQWSIEADDVLERPPMLGGGRRFDKDTGLAIRGLTSDGRWALIPVDRDSVTVALESDRIHPSRIDRVELRPAQGPSSIVFDRSQGTGDSSRLTLTQPDRFLCLVTARDPDGRAIRASLRIFCGAELRPTRVALDAMDPVIELEVGGQLKPELLKATIGRDGPPLEIEEEKTSWELASRVLRIPLRPSAAVGAIDDVHLEIRWPNGFVQLGPSIGSFTLEPRIDFQPVPAKVGVPGDVRVRSAPEPIRARVDGHVARFETEAVHFVPSRPGDATVELEYPTVDGGREWIEAGSLSVQPAAVLDLPPGTDASRGLQLVVRDVEPSLHGLELALSLGGEIRDRWTAGAVPHPWSGSIPDTDPLEVAVIAPASALTLCSNTIRVYAGFEFNYESSLPVTAADGSLEAELAFVGPSGWNRSPVEQALTAEGFVLRGWSNGTLRVVGSERTLGSHVVSIVDGARKVTVRMVTLSDLSLSLFPGGSFEAGAAASLHSSAGEIAAGLASVDDGPLVIEVERVAPVFDALSARVIGNRVHFLHPGRYVVSLSAYRRRLAHVDADVHAPRRPAIPIAPACSELTATSAYDASVLAAGYPPCASIAILSPPRESYRVVQDTPSGMEERLWQFLSACLTAKKNVLVSWPGLALGELGGRLLRRLRAEQMQVSVAHLSYPAPRGDIASDEAHARTLRAHRVLCSVRASATIDRSDAYRCTKCSGSPRLKTDSNRIWQECPDCGYADRDLVLSLMGLRSTDVQVLFADFRIAKYLTRGRGRRYAGAFGRSVRCSNCHGLQSAFAKPVPWDRAELRGLLGALATAWNGRDEPSSIRRAAYQAARRARRSRPDDVARLEDALRRLIDAGVIEQGRVADQSRVERLEAGISLCCGRPLMWSSRRAVYVFLDVEELLDPAVPTSMHPDLAFGQVGVRQFIALGD